MQTITVRLSGGLGNQLFQYAASRALALRMRAALEFDTQSFARDPLKRTFALDRFPIAGTRRDLVGWRQTIVEAPGLWRFARATGFTPRVGGTRFFFDRLRGFDARIDELCTHLVLTGYWQDERYFEPSFGSMQDEFDLDERVARPVRYLGEEFALNATLAVHVRRADFVDSESPHGACPPSYYARALQFLRERTKIDRIVVFSDDPAWASATLELGQTFETVARTRERTDIDDLWLMSRCRHLVIANSSYSWWAARFAESRRAAGTTMVVCPARWYMPTAGPIPHPAPQRWHRIVVD